MDMTGLTKVLRAAAAAPAPFSISVLASCEEIPGTYNNPDHMQTTFSDYAEISLFRSAGAQRACSSRVLNDLNALRNMQ